MYYIVPVYKHRHVAKRLTPALRALHLVHIFRHMMQKNVLSYTALPLHSSWVQACNKIIIFYAYSGHKQNNTWLALWYNHEVMKKTDLILLLVLISHLNRVIYISSKNTKISSTQIHQGWKRPSISSNPTQNYQTLSPNAISWCLLRTSTSGDGDSTTSQDNLFQWLNTLKMKNNF